VKPKIGMEVYLRNDVAKKGLISSKWLTGYRFSGPFYVRRIIGKGHSVELATADCEVLNKNVPVKCLRVDAPNEDFETPRSVTHVSQSRGSSESRVTDADLNGKFRKLLQLLTSGLGQIATRFCGAGHQGCFVMRAPALMSHVLYCGYFCSLPSRWLQSGFSRFSRVI